MVPCTPEPIEADAAMIARAHLPMLVVSIKEKT